MAETDQGVTSLAAGGEPENSEATSQDNQPQTTETTGGEELKLSGFDEKDSGILGRFKSQNGLAKSYLELFKRMERTVAIPGENAKPEEVEAFYKRLGRPDSPDGYELETVYLPDGVTKADMGEENFKKIAHKLGLTKAQAKELHKWAVDTSLDQVKQVRQVAEQKKREASEVLRKEYGLDYDKKIALMGQVNRKFGGDEWIQFLNEGPGNDPRLIRVLVKIGESISEDTLVQGRPPGATGLEEREPGVFSYPNRPEVTGNRFRSVR